MDIASKLRHQNIVAYILYLYQVEDIIRSMSMDIDRIRDEYLPRFNYPEDRIAPVVEWYEGLIRMMHEEGCTQTGHVQVVRNTIMMATERHQELLRDPKQPFYSAAYYKALPFIVELRQQGNNRDRGEIENCLDAMYGVTLLKMQGKEITTETKTAISAISNMMNMLAELFDKTE